MCECNLISMLHWEFDRFEFKSMQCVCVCVRLYLRQYLFFLVCSRVRSREEFFQSSQSSTGLCYFFVGACPSKFLSVHLHLTHKHTHKHT